MTLKHFIATSNLGIHFLNRLLKRILMKKSPGLSAFIAYYREDRIFPFTAEEKKLLGNFSKCTSCGLCDSECPSLIDAHSQTRVLPSSLAHVVRSVPDFYGHIHVDAETRELCQSCTGCDMICPERVEIRKIFEFIDAKNREQPGTSD